MLCSARIQETLVEIFLITYIFEFCILALEKTGFCIKIVLSRDSAALAVRLGK